MKSTYTNASSRCPACQTKLTGATDMEGDDAPSPGDHSVCIYCGMLGVFNDDLTLRAMRTDEFEALPAKVKRKLSQHQRVAAVIAAKRDTRRKG